MLVKNAGNNTYTAMEVEDIKSIKKKITVAIKELERTDYVDICILIKSKAVDTSKIVCETPRGTFIDLDCVDEPLLRQLDHMISTKLQRIMRA
jgi:hypothetical protein